MNADRNLLFGILALQNNFVTRDQLVEAMNAWTLVRHRSLGSLLRQRGSLSAKQHKLIEALVICQVEHHGDAGKSLRELEVTTTAHRALAAVADADVQASLSQVVSAPSDPTTDHVGRPDGSRYRVLRPLARGGLGEVFVAEDTELHREVALKEIQEVHAHDVNSRGRFLLEAEITGRLEHPGIVPVYGLGRYDDGRVYYAMRLVKGDTLKHAIRQFHNSKAGFDGLAFRQLLRRFLDACNAVAYAHARGILHRDLKPGNVLLGEFGVTLVVDWGLAKVIGRSNMGTHPPGAEPTIRPAKGSGLVNTAMGAVVGTPAYMSPEQAEGKRDTLGPATDIYGLGATLYSVLTGRSPAPGDDVAAVLAKVRAGDIVPPCQARPGVPKALAAIVAKAMAARPGDRYATVPALVTDLEHWLADEPVSTYRDPVLMRFARWRRKNRALVTAAGAVMLMAVVSLGAGLAVVSRMRQKITIAYGQLTGSLIEAKQQRDIADAVKDFLLRDLLYQADAGSQMIGVGPAERNPNITVKELLDRAAREIENRFREDPVTEAAIRHTIGEVYHALGKYEEARSHLARSESIRERHFGSDNQYTLASKCGIALLDVALGKTDKAKPRLIELTKRCEYKLGADHPVTLAANQSLGLMYGMLGSFDSAEPLLRDALARHSNVFGPDHILTLQSAGNLATLYQMRGRSDLAEPLMSRLSVEYQKKLGPDHIFTLVVKNNLATQHLIQGDVGKAEPLIIEVIEQARRKLEPDHFLNFLAKSNYAVLLNFKQQPEMAEPLFMEVLPRLEKKLEIDHIMVLLCKCNLGITQTLLGKSDLAEPHLIQAVPMLSNKFGNDHQLTLMGKNNLALTYTAQEKFNLAEPLFLEVLSRNLNRPIPDPSMAMTCKSNLAFMYSKQEKMDDADRLFQQAMTEAIAAFGWGNPSATRIHDAYTFFYERWGKPEKSQVVMEQRLAFLRANAGPKSTDTASAMSLLGLNLLQQKKFAEAEPLLLEGLRIREAAQPDLWNTFNTRSMLGEALFQQGKNYLEAEQLLIQGYEGLKQREEKIGPQIRQLRQWQALVRLVEFYEVMNDKEKATKWRKKLDSLSAPGKGPAKK